jgi:hypothetical protein
MKRALSLTVLLAIVLFHAPRSEAQWRFGGSSEFFAPLGDLSSISIVGLTFGMYAGRMLDRKHWAFTVDGGFHWFLPEELRPEDVPDWVPNPNEDRPGQVSLSGTFLPLRASITRFLGRYYIVARGGVYFPLGDFRNEVELSTMFGVAPRFGYFFPVARGVQFDLALEYNYLFGDLEMHYVGVGMGLFFGGRRFTRGKRFF